MAIRPLVRKFPAVTWADLIQMASACSIEVTGGPRLPMRYGRRDVADGGACPGRSSRGTADNAGLPDAMAPFGCGATDAATHLRPRGEVKWDKRRALVEKLEIDVVFVT